MGVLGFRYCTLVQLNLADGSVNAVRNIAQTGSLNTMLPRCLYTNGIELYAAYNINGTEKLDFLVPKGNTFITRLSETPSPVGDVCFDGTYFYILDTTNVYQLPGPHVADPIVKSWAHGVSSVRGITTDGNQLIIMSA